MTTFPLDHELGRIDIVTLGDAPALSLDVPDTPADVADAWPAFTARFDESRTRVYMGLHDPVAGTYRLSSVLMDAGDESDEGLERTVMPGGPYLRLRMRGVADPQERLGEAFEALEALVQRDETRPHIEYYRGPGQIDCLMPIDDRGNGQVGTGA